MNARESKCGVCNEVVPIEHTQLGRRESDGTITPYHMYCESQVKNIKPCEDCGQHRNCCDDCGEPMWEEES